MTSDRHRAVTRILGEILDAPPPEREALVERLCAGDHALRHEVAQLLAQQDVAAAFLENPPLRLGDPDPAEDEAPPIGQVLGPYRLIREIGRGGMGAVFLAERDDDQYQRRVAIKLIKRGMDTDAIQRRFRRERQILANFDHPYIATLFDGGATRDGRPYLVMEYVDGEPITRYARAHQLDEARLLKLFLNVCEAVQYAHDHDVAHGDIKPANILVTGDGVPTLLDFGIARILNPLPTESDATTGGRRPRTPDYASPEQLRDEPITAQSDIYSLGAVLHELLAGKPPTQQRPRAALGGDLGNIVHMALREDPEQRYESVAALADDLSRYLEGRPVAARQIGLSDRVRSLVRRHRTVVGLVTAVAILGLLMGVFATWLALGPPRNHSIAVLPFTTMDAEQSSEILADAITDSLIGSFAAVPALRAPGRGSVFRFKGQPIAPDEAAKTLRVDTLLMGRVSANADRLSIEASLFDAAREQIVWTHHYDIRREDLLTLHESIVADVARQLKVADQIGRQLRGGRRYTRSDTAYRHYVIGRYYWNQRRDEMYVKGIEHFQAAIAADPSYALAYSGLADCYSLLGAYLARPAHEAFPAAKAAALQAVSLDDTLAEGHTSLAFVAWLYEWNWPQADEEFRRAIVLDPRLVRAHHWYALFLGEMGRAAEAEVQMRQALDLDPVFAPIWGDFGRLHYWARQYDKSREFYRQAFALGATPSFLYEARDLYEQTDPEEYLRVNVELRVMNAQQVAEYRNDGPRVFWRNDLRKLLPNFKGRMEIVEAYARIGDKDAAFAAMNEAFDRRDHRMTQLKVNPILDPLRDDPRFDQMLERMNLARTVGTRPTR